MNRKITYHVLLGVALLSVCAVTEAKSPSCAQPLGKWSDESQSVIEISSYNTATGAISGKFISPSEGVSFPMIGWINPAPGAPGARDKTGEGDHADVFTLAVRWGDFGSVTAWTGTCTVNPKSGRAQISTLWHTSHPNVDAEWRHILTGSELLVPFE